MLAILALLEGPFGKLIMYGIAALFIGASVFTGVAIWKHNIKMEALANYNATQLKQAEADNARFQAQLDAIKKSAADIFDNMTKTNSEQAAKDKATSDWLDSAEAKSKDRPSSEILKETVRRISK